MKKSLLIVFLLLVSVPLILLSWLSITSFARERDSTAERFGILARSQLVEIDRLVVSTVGTAEQELLANTTVLNFGDADGIRDVARNSALVGRLFKFDTDGTFLFPPENGEMSSAERDFIDRAMGLELTSMLTARAGDGPRAAAQNHHWYTWFMGDGLNFIFWHPQPNGEIYGVEVSRAAFISLITAALPNSDPDSNDEYTTRTVITDARGNTLYQWGLYAPSEDMMPTAEIPLSPPLGAWHLRIYVDLETGGFAAETRRYVSTVSGILALVAVVIFLALYYYRQNTKIVRDAMQKVSFVNQVSHELKTPLTNIRLYAELLETRLTEGRDSENLSVIISESTRLGRMINNVLTFARGERAGFEPALSEVVIDDIVERVTDSFAPSLKSKGFAAEMRLGAPAVVITDEDFVEQILSNLIGNVEKYAATGKYIEVVSWQDTQNTWVSITDRGPGIPSREQRNIFRPFYRISNDLTDGVSGAGIGLAVSRNLAGKIGGSLILGKTTEGAMFTLQIPNNHAGEAE